MANMWWQHKGSVNYTITPDQLLQNQDRQQRFHLYIPRHDFVREFGNDIFDLPSCSVHLTDAKLLHQFDTHLPQPMPWCMWTPSINIIYCIVSTIQRIP